MTWRAWLFVGVLLVRWVLASWVLVQVYHQAGGWTALVLALVAIRFECEDLAATRQTRRVTGPDRP